jgi:hypothetical protein
MPNGHKIKKMAIKYRYKHLPLQDPPKITQIGIFWFGNIPSGNPALLCQEQNLVGEAIFSEIIF